MYSDCVFDKDGGICVSFISLDCCGFVSTQVVKNISVKAYILFITSEHSLLNG